MDEGPSATGAQLSKDFDYDVVVVGSGFGGSVAALRLSEKGYRVVVLEAGQRFDDDNLPKTSWDVRRFVWAPWLGCFGIQRVNFLRNVVVLGGAGVGGGSLNYANTLYEPLPAFYDDPQWVGLTDWRSELAPFYDQAKRMLGVVDNPTMTLADEAMLKVATEMGAEETFRTAPVGVWFGPQGADATPGQSYPDPFFGGAGPDRRACTQCGECMTGCRHGAKNTLLTNYLHLAERAGAEVRPLSTVKSLETLPGGGWEVTSVRTGALRLAGLAGRATAGRGAGALATVRLRAEHVVLSAGTVGTQRLLHKLAWEGKLPNLSNRLGELTRTNSESLLGVVVPRRAARAAAEARGHDFTRGVAITSSFYPEPGTHVEPVRYGKGSSTMGLFGTVLVDGTEDGRGAGWPALWATITRHPRELLEGFDLRGWSGRAVIALVMQARDNSLTLHAKRGVFGRAKLTSRQGHGEPNPTWLPVGHEVVRRLASAMKGRPVGTWGELFGVPMTAHFLGGCVIGASAAEGVVDPWHRVYGHAGLHVADGSVVSANPGVNPALTITALAERAFSHWPNKGDADPRAPLGAPYVRLPAVRPQRPAVPAGAFGELRVG